MVVIRKECEMRTGVATPDGTRLIDALDLYFGKGGKLENIQFFEISGLALEVYGQYLTFEGADAVSRPVADAAEPGAGGVDEALSNTIHFLRVSMWYLELCAATAEGDIGRVFEVIKVCYIFSLTFPSV
jgi:hypothetical protein